MNPSDSAATENPLSKLISGLAGAMALVGVQQIEREKELAVDIGTETVLNGSDPHIGYFVFPPTTVVWYNRGNFVEIAVAQLGEGDVFDLKKGVRVAVEHLFAGNFILVPCNSKVPGFSAHEVVARLFDVNVLNGNALFDRGLLEKSKATFNAEMARRGAAPTNV